MPQTIIREGAVRNLTWWEQYAGSLRGVYGVPSNFSQNSINEIDRSTDEILGSGNIPDLDSDDWDEFHGLRIGAVVGSIQSGKTANMIGVAAKGLDRGFKIVVVLSGLKNDLRSQTARRFCRDLLCKGEPIIRDGVVIGSTHPLGDGSHGPRDDCWSPNVSGDVNHQEGYVNMQLRKQIRKGNSVLIVAKKNVQTLRSLENALSGLSRRIPAAELPILIIDDEFDEASVQRDPDAPTPTRITRLWGNRGHKVAYVGYTATIQANILQERTNPLWPRNFIELLRYPATRDSPLTFYEPNPNARYTGSEVFFNYLNDHNERNFLIDCEMSDSEFEGRSRETPKLEQAIISYFVSGAVRLILSGKSLTDTNNLAPPHSMLLHTQLEIEEHWEMVQQVMRLVRKKGGEPSQIPPNYRRMPPQERMNPDCLTTWLNSDAEQWKAAYDEFLVSSMVMMRVQPDRTRYEFPSWSEVKQILPEVFARTKLRVVNSDDLSMDLDFSIPVKPDGSQGHPRDLYSIIVGGNKLSRGLTLEGLCISYFCRSSEIIAEDTIVQRERWFGYRGSHLEFCRLFSNRHITDSLRRFVYHEIDLKEQFIRSKIQGVRLLDSHSFRFLRLAHTTPAHVTGRGRLRHIQFSGTKPFIQRVQMGQTEAEIACARNNVSLFSEYCDRIIEYGQKIKNSGGREIGACLYDQSANDVISLLNGLKFTFHNPNPNSQTFVNLFNEMRPHDTGSNPAIGFSLAQDPYLIAAYLAYWRNGFENRDQTLQDNTGMDWVPIPVPKFNIALRFGSLPPESPFNFALMDREISTNGTMISAWGSRGYGTPHMDEWFDAPVPHDTLPLFRSQGENGLVLIHVVSKNSQGRNGTGEISAYPRPTLAMSIPLGGPSVLSVDVGESDGA